MASLRKNAPALRIGLLALAICLIGTSATYAAASITTCGTTMSGGGELTAGTVNLDGETGMQVEFSGAISGTVDVASTGDFELAHANTSGTAFAQLLDSNGDPVGFPFVWYIF